MHRLGNTIKRNAKQRLEDWISTKKAFGIKYIKTSEVYCWGVDNHSNRAVRNMQDFANEREIIERIPRPEAIMLGFSGKEGVWRIL